ncbi:hypothetical protein AB0F39_34530 [Streptomyces murinus]
MTPTQEQHHTASTRTRSTPPVTRTRPISPEARAYAELGGIQ